MGTPSKNNNQDFVADSYLTKDTHAKDMQAMSDRLTNLENKLGDSEKFTQEVKKSIIDNTGIQKEIRSVVLTQITTDKEINDHLVLKISSEDRNFFYKSLKRFGAWVVGVVLIVIGIVAKTLFDLAVSSSIPK